MTIQFILLLVACFACFKLGAQYGANHQKRLATDTLCLLCKKLSSKGYATPDQFLSSMKAISDDIDDVLERKHGRRLD